MNNDAISKALENAAVNRALEEFARKGVMQAYRSIAELAQNAAPKASDIPGDRALNAFALGLLDTVAAFEGAAQDDRT